MSRSWSRRRWLLVFAVVCAAVFAPALSELPRYKDWDYGPHHVLARSLLRGLAEGHVPRYLVGVSTGDSPYETYPVLTYGVAAAAAWLAGGEAQVPAVLVWLALACHVGIAVFVARIAEHVAPAPVALLVGLFAFADAGSFGSGAATVLEVGLLHGALAQVLLLALFDLVLAAARARARAPRVIALCMLAALAAAAHPSSLLFLAALLLALLFAIALARCARRRELAAAGWQLGAGVLLSAFAWMPLASRVLSHGLHFAYPAPPLEKALADFAELRLPPSSFPVLLGLGFAGVLLGLLRRRGAELVLAAVVALLLLGFTELPHRLYFEWLPRPLARMQSFRFLTLAQPLLFATAAIPLAVGWRGLRSRLPARLANAAGLVALGCIALASASASSRAFPTGVAPLRALLRSEVEDREGFLALVEWARERSREASPQRFARLLWDGEENGVYHVSAESGLPALFVGDGVAMLLREKLEDTGALSLRRFNVRWVAARGRAPRLGDPSGERRFGSYVVRELKEWDGMLARVERGAGTLRVEALADERIEVELAGTDQPALVALGIGYYPRWRARGPEGRPLPVYAWPATVPGSVRVVAAWLPPGRSVFVADGPLPSDGSGRLPTLAGLAALALLFAPLPFAVATGARLRFGARALVVGAAVLTAASCLLPRGVAVALRLVPRLWPEAEVLARVPDGVWVPCGFSPLRRDFVCPGLGRVADTAAFVVGDHPASTPFLTPGIVARPERNRVEFRVLTSPALQGRYWAAGWGAGRSQLRCGAEIDQTLPRARTPAEFPPGRQGSCEVLLRTAGGNAQGLTLVRQDALDVDRSRDVPWPPPEAPAESRR